MEDEVEELLKRNRTINSLVRKTRDMFSGIPEYSDRLPDADFYLPETRSELERNRTSCAVKEQDYRDSLQPLDEQLLAAYDAHDINALKCALDCGANPDVWTGWNGNPLVEEAAFDVWPEAVESLLDAGADPMQDDGELLVILSERGPAHILRRVLQMPGISPDFERGGDTLAVLAAEEGQLECLRELRAAGADLLANGGKALCRACRENQVETARYLLEQCGADPEEEYDDWTPLFYAAQSNAMGCALLLLEFGADPQHRDIVGDTPLRWAESGAMRKLLKQYCC